MMRIPILMHHKIGALNEGRPDACLNVPAPVFAGQIRLLSHLGFQAVTFAQAVEGMRTGQGLPPRPVCFTFDDAFDCVAEHALPLLTQYGWPATVFVPTTRVGGTNL